MSTFSKTAKLKVLGILEQSQTLDQSQRSLLKLTNRKAKSINVSLTSLTPFMRIPNELILQTCLYLSNQDILNLCLTSKHLHVCCEEALYRNFTYRTLCPNALAKFVLQIVRRPDLASKVRSVHLGQNNADSGKLNLHKNEVTDLLNAARRARLISRITFGQNVISSHLPSFSDWRSCLGHGAQDILNFLLLSQLPYLQVLVLCKKALYHRWWEEICHPERGHFTKLRTFHCSFDAMKVSTAGSRDANLFTCICPSARNLILTNFNIRTKVMGHTKAALFSHSQFVNAPTLTMLDLSNVAIDGSALPLLLKNSQNLQSFKLTSRSIVDHGYVFVKPSDIKTSLLRYTKSLKQLHISFRDWVPVPSDQFEKGNIIDELREFTALEYLRIDLQLIQPHILGPQEEIIWSSRLPSSLRCFELDIEPQRHCSQALGYWFQKPLQDISEEFPDLFRVALQSRHRPDSYVLKLHEKKLNVGWVKQDKYTVWIGTGAGESVQQALEGYLMRSQSVTGRRH